MDVEQVLKWVAAFVGVVAVAYGIERMRAWQRGGAPRRQAFQRTSRVDESGTMPMAATGMSGSADDGRRDVADSHVTGRGESERADPRVAQGGDTDATEGSGCWVGDAGGGDGGGPAGGADSGGSAGGGSD